METKHTPLPWHDSGGACLSGPGGEAIAIFQDLFGPAQANLDFALRFFNSHAALTDALDQCVEALENAHELIHDAGHDPNGIVLEQIHSALAAAKKAKELT